MGVDVEQLKSRIRKSAASRELKEGQSARRLTSSQLQTRHSQFDLSDIKLSPDFKPRRDNHYHVNDLLKFHDQDFVRNAYRAILGREPDEPGSTSHLQYLRSGRRNKLDILASLRYSAEGRSRNVRVDGLRFPALVRSLTRLPMIGYVYELVFGVLRLPIAIYHTRQFQTHTIAQQQLIADHVNRVTQTVRALEPFVAEVLALRQDFQSHGEQFANLHLRTEQYAQQFSEIDGALLQMSREDQLLKDQLTTQDLFLQRTHHEQITHSERLDELRIALHEQRLELSAQHARLLAGLETSAERSALSLTKGQDVGAERTIDLDPLLTQLEDRFRGERAELKDKFSFYLPYLEQEGITEDVLDVGCGRGEWLELLKETGLEARGVDSNRLMVEACAGAGLNVILTDLFDHFAGLPDNSLSAVTAFHVIEHLKFPQLVHFIDHCIRVLRPGGLLILETPNPENAIVATRTFYLDPTHVTPLPRELIQFVLEARGLVNVEVVGLHPLTEARVAGDTEVANRLNDLYYGPMDYGVIARRS